MDLSIIIPTFNEMANITQLTERITVALQKKNLNYDIWFIDDSTDETPVMLAAMAKKDQTIRFIHRQSCRGLGQAVVEGFRASKGHHIIVMDADLQHPPELLPEIYDALKSGVDLVLPTRFIQGGSDGGLTFNRKMVSYVARKLGQICIKSLRDVSDCTSGFFGLKRTVIEGISLNPTSWKILIEILVKGHYHSKKEIAYSFVSRDSGTSKMHFREQWNYVRHILSLCLQRLKKRAQF